MALCILTKVLTIKAFEAGLIFATFFFIPVISAPTAASMDTIEGRLTNPCGYRRPIRHSRSAKEKLVEEQFQIFRYEYTNMTRLRIDELYNVPTNLDTLKFPIKLPILAFKNKKRNYESLQIYIKAFDTLANQNGHIPTTGNFTLEKRKYIFDLLANSSLRLLCVMYDEQKKHPKLKPKVISFNKHLKPPLDFTSLYTQDLLVLNDFGKFVEKLNNFMLKKNRRKKKNQKNEQKATGFIKKSPTPRTKTKGANKKNPQLKNKRKSLRTTS